MPTISQSIIDDLKKINWQYVIDYSNSLDGLNDRQLRFMKGWIIELLVENQEKDNTLIYVGEDHRDFIWPKHNIEGELKSQVSKFFYTKNGELQDANNIQFNNSNGTNKSTIDPNLVCDIILIVRADGACIADKETVLKGLRHYGDGFRLDIPKEKLIQISGHIKSTTKYSLDFKTLFKNAILESIRQNDPCLKK